MSDNVARIKAALAAGLGQETAEHCEIKYYARAYPKNGIHVIGWYFRSEGLTTWNYMGPSTDVACEVARQEGATSKKIGG